jgi:hypothetical protein
MTGAISEASREALSILRDGSNFTWSSVTLLGLVFYVYAVEVERRRWDVVLAGLGFFLTDVFNELVNSAIFHVSDRAPLWAVTGDTSFLVLIGWNIEIIFLFLITGIVFVKMLPPDPRMRILGIPNRWLLAFLFSCLCVAVEIFLEWTGTFHWDYWWWNVPFVPLIVVFGYMTFFLVAAWVFDQRDMRGRLRIVGAIAAVDLVLGVAFGLAGWL